MKIVLDTNVLVSAFVSPFGPCSAILGLFAAGDLTLCIDPRLLAEYGEVLRRPKFRLDLFRVEETLIAIAQEGHMVAARPLATRLPDPGDQAFLEVAVAGRAECLVTYNGAHFPRRLCQDVRVVSPTEFLEFYRKQVSKTSGE